MYRKTELNWNFFSEIFYLLMGKLDIILLSALFGRSTLVIRVTVYARSNKYIE